MKRTSVCKHSQQSAVFRRHSARPSSPGRTPSRFRGSASRWVAPESLQIMYRVQTQPRQADSVKKLLQLPVGDAAAAHVLLGVRVDDLVAQRADGHVGSLGNVEELSPGRLRQRATEQGPQLFQTHPKSLSTTKHASKHTPRPVFWRANFCRSRSDRTPARSCPTWPAKVGLQCDVIYWQQDKCLPPRTTGPWSKRRRSGWLAARGQIWWCCQRWPSYRNPAQVSLPARLLHLRLESRKTRILRAINSGGVLTR